MGQYYDVVILSDNKNTPEIIRMAISPWQFCGGTKLMEHSYMGSTLVQAVEYLLSKQGMFYNSRIVWAGDYADEEEGLDFNLFQIVEGDAAEAANEVANNYAQEANEIAQNYFKQFDYATKDLRYIINHTKKQYVDKVAEIERQTQKSMEENGKNVLRYYVHPLPLLVAEGNGRGGGDYYGDNQELCGSWARDIICVDNNAPPADYIELVCGFKEN